jgi:hypothetical protein
MQSATCRFVGTSGKIAPCPEAITGKATLVAWFRCCVLVSGSPRPFGPSWRGLAGLDRVIRAVDAAQVPRVMTGILDLLGKVLCNPH